MIVSSHITEGNLPTECAGGACRRGCWARLVASFFARIERMVPLGYEDDAGFHYGRPVLD
jgi:hypothetical protein